MPVTAIRTVVNLGTDTAYIKNIESPGDTGGVGQRHTLAPAPKTAPHWTKWDHEIWIPWATSSQEFDHHHLEVSFDDSLTVYIWQANYPADGDHVRASTDGWHSENHIMDESWPHLGLPTVGGDRTLVIFGQRVFLAPYPPASSPTRWNYTLELDFAQYAHIEPCPGNRNPSASDPIEGVGSQVQASSSGFVFCRCSVRAEKITEDGHR